MSSANSILTLFNTRIGIISGTPFNETSVGGSIIFWRPDRWQTVVVLLKLIWRRVRLRQHPTIRSCGRNLTELSRIALSTLRPFRRIAKLAGVAALFAVCGTWSRGVFVGDHNGSPV